MRSLALVFAPVLALVACSSPHSTPSSTPQSGPRPVANPEVANPDQPGPLPGKPLVEVMTADTPRTTVEGNSFTAPAGWGVRVRGPATILDAPEGDSHIALVDVRAKDADAAVAAGWAAYKPDAKWPMKIANDSPDKEGWTHRRSYSYQTSPNEKRDVAASVQKAGDIWTIVIYDMTSAVGEKRGAQVALIFGRMLPKGYARETFAGKPANKLDAARVAELGKFIENARVELGVPGVALGLVQDGKVVFAGGYGVRELGKQPAVDGDTMFMIASNTKALTTLLLAKLVEQNKLTWDTQVTTLYPPFKLGDADTTSRVLVKHLICACTGLPRQDLEWIFQFAYVTPEKALAALATMQPTSKFGEMFQYSNPLAGAAGLIAGHVAFPKLELGAAYDRAMQLYVFDPLGMKSTTFDYKRALRGNHAGAHATDIDGKPANATMALNYAVIPLRPAGAAWSNVRDMLKYVSMELAEGALPDGKRYIAKEPLLERRAPKVPIGKDTTYGMGLMVDTTYGVPVVHHGGDLVGYHSDMIWLPGHNVGAVILTSSDPGGIIRSVFRRKLLEVLFDGKPEADASIASTVKRYFEELANERKLMTVPADATEAGKLSERYESKALGDIKVTHVKGKTVFDFGEWKSEVASRKNPDGSISFLTIAPGISGLEFVVGGGAKPTLVTRDGQHEYIFEEIIYEEP